MTSVFLMLVIELTNPGLATKHIQLTTFVFESASRCLRNVDVIKKQSKADEITVECREEKIYKGK